jgi:ABC-2 type transport system permease protein
MNIYLRELRAYRKSTLFWCLGVVFMIAATMAKYQGLGTAADFTAMMNQLPPVVLAIFGINMLDFGKASGFYGVAYLFLALMAAIHAVLLGADILSKEERDRTSEFLYVKPVTRGHVITAKALAALTNVILYNLITMASSIAIVNKYSNGEDVSGYIRVLMAGMFMLQLIYLGAGLAAAALTGRPKAASGIATGFMLATFLLSNVIDINTGLKPLRFLTPFKYFDPKTLYTAMRLSAGYVALSLALTAAFTALTYLLFRRRDLRI